MRENKTMKKFVCGLMAAVMLACALPMSAFGAETSQKYTIDLGTISDKEWENSEVRLKFTLNTKSGLVTKSAYWGEYVKEQTWEPTLGKPVLLDYVVDEATQQKLAITWAPIRLVANTIGVEIDWVEKTDTEEAHAVLHTSKYGDVNLYLNATEIRYGDNVYREQTYTFPDNTPIPLCLLKDVYDAKGNYIGGRIYIPVRGISTFLLDGETRYVWKNASTLNVVGNIDGITEVQKTYGINENYAAIDGTINLDALPHLAEALEGTNSKISSASLLDLYTTGDVHGNENHLLVDAATHSIDVTGFDPLGDQTQLKVLDAMLTDLICDADRISIMELLQNVNEHMTPGWTKKGGYTEEAMAWRDALIATTPTFTETKIEFNAIHYGEEFYIRSK